jgi:hypothetical protein
VLFLASITAPFAFGQAPTSPIAFAKLDGITTSFVPAINQGGTAGGSSSPAQWLKVELHYGTTPNLKTKYLDAVQFKIIIEGRDPDAVNSTGGKGVSVGFTGEITYVNIPAGKDIYGVFYVHPSTLARYSLGGSEDFDRKFNIHVDANIGGAQMDWFDKRPEKDLNWYKVLTPISGLVFRQDQCPFIMADTDRYPAMKISAAGQ